MTEIGSRQWNDSAEMSEWAFMARVMREAKDLLPMNFSPLGVAIDIADARAKSGWRTVPDDDFAPDQTAKIARLQAIQEAADACTNLIKNYEVMKPDGKTYESLKMQKAAKGMVSLARQDIEALAAKP